MTFVVPAINGLKNEFAGYQSFFANFLKNRISKAIGRFPRGDFSLFLHFGSFHLFIFIQKKLAQV